MRAPCLIVLLAAVSIAFSPVLPAAEKTPTPTPTKMSPHKTKPSRAAMMSSAPIALLPQRLRALNDALQVRIKGKLAADAAKASAQFQQIKGMTVRVCPTPRIESIFPFSNFTPGGTVLITGCGFGAVPSTFVMTLWNGQDIAFGGVQWSNSGIAGTLPGLENGPLSSAATQSVTLRVTTPAGSDRSAPVTYHAGHFIQAYPFNRLTIGVSQAGNSNECYSGVSDEGICTHEMTWWRPDEYLPGKDTFTVDLKNGWTLDSWNWTGGGCCIDRPSGPSHSGQGQSHWTETINWFIPCHDDCTMWYYIDVFAEGEIGSRPW